MGSCPKCKSSVAVNDVNCPKCGALLAGIPEKSGTLNANQHFQFSEDVAPARLATNELTTPGGGDHVGDSSDTLGAKDLSKALPEKEGSSGTFTSDDSHESDSSKTIRLPADSREADGGEEVSSTQNFTESDLRMAMGIGDSGTDGQLKRVWDAAIGSSGKDSKQSLRFERAEASDSVFRRVAVRLIADANATQTEGADYQIQDKLGEGGMGMVYSALQTAVNRVVAIKTIKAEKFEDIEARKQFFYEAEVTAELDHPNIPAIYELGRTEDGTLFYSMKLIRGIEWQKLLRKKTREENLEIFGKIADAVAFAHSKNVIHRDLKPDNVMLGTFGEVYLSDWGLAVNQTKKRDIDFGGTPEYMAPEMARNQRDRIGKHSDIYLLGAILYQIVTGTPPHMGRTQRHRLVAATKNEITPTDKEDPLLNIARRAMETDPSLRHASVAEFQEEIHAVNTHAESIALANRSSDVAASAAQLQDYDRFTRAIFGFRDAIDMWADNKTAKVGLENARFAYGQCAFDKGDYDLALQTLDRAVPREADVYEKAKKAKLALEQRDARFKTLTRAFVAAVSFLLLVAIGFAFYANTQRISADMQTKIAVGALDNAKAAAEAEKKAKETAIGEKLAADVAKEKEKIARIAADNATMQANTEKVAADMARQTAEDEKMIAQMARTEADMAKVAAVTAKGEAEKSAEQEKAARKISQSLAVKNRISGSVEQLGRANSSTSQFDNQGASIVLERTKKFIGQEFEQITKEGVSAIGNIPKFDTFAWERVSLLTNEDLPKLSNSKVKTMDFAPAVKVGIVGTQDGQLKVFRYDADGLKNEDFKVDFPGSTIDCVAISPNGDEAMFSKTTGTTNSTYVWSLVGKSEPVEASVLGAKSFQAMRYSPDGKRIVAGINGGIRVLTRAENWKSKGIEAIKEIDLKKNIRSVRGDLRDLQWVDANTILASAKIEKNVVLFVLNVDNLTSTKISLPESIGDSLSAATMLGSGKRLLFATGDGKLSVGDIKVGKVKEETVLSVENILELAAKHSAAISRLVVNADDRILSISDNEPVVHVWRQAKAGGEVLYDTYLTGVPGSKASTPNIINALFATDDSILGLDDYGTSIVWSIERQKQRRQLKREEYPASVVGNYGRGTTPQAISVTEDGVVDLWNLQTGRTDKRIGRFSYFGHTPGAVFVDSAVDLKSGIIVTSASLDKAERSYLQDASHNWEFCVWDLSTGNMIKRWSLAAPSDPNKGKETKNSSEPRMTMLNDGKEILIANFSQTLIYTVYGERVSLNAKSDNVATYFAVPNPKNPSLIAMVNQSSLVWLWDRSDANSWWKSDPNNPILRSREDEGIPLKGVWTEDGNRFFLVFSSGFVKVYDKGNFLRPALTSASDDKAKSVLKITEHHNIDLASAPIADGVDRLIVNVRLPGNDPRLVKSVVFTLDAKPNRIDESKREFQNGLLWLDAATSGSPKLSSRFHPSFRLNPKSSDSVLASQKQGTHTFVATKAGTIYDITDDRTAFASVGIQELISSTSDREGSVVMQLRQDGSILRLDLPAEGENKWSKAEFAAVGFSKIQLSPNKVQLAMLNTDKHLLRIVNAVSGGLIGEYENVAAACWDPAADSVMAIIHVDGKVEMTGLNEPIVLRNADVKDGRKVKSVHFFNEAWVAEEATRYLLVQSEKDGEEMSGRIEFVALKPKIDKGEISDKGEMNGLDVKSGLTIATSPVDSLFVTGDDAGTVTVWFASPTWDKPGKIFDLEGHRGASITSIAFGENGQTLMTSDANKRLYGWISRDLATPKN